MNQIRKERCIILRKTQALPREMKLDENKAQLLELWANMVAFISYRNGMRIMLVDAAKLYVHFIMQNLYLFE